MPTESKVQKSKNATKLIETNEAKLKLKQKVGWKKPIPRKNAVKSSATPPPNSAQLNSIRQYLSTTQPTTTEATAGKLPPEELKTAQPPPLKRKSPRIMKLSRRFETEDPGGT